MKENLTEIVVIIDASGSMHNFSSDTIGGFNAFIEEQKKVSGEANITLTTFNSINPNNIIFNGINIQNCPELNSSQYKPDGMTPLYDAIGDTIRVVGMRLSNMPEEDRPSKVLFLITTDGLENSSISFTREKISNIINHQKTKYNWEFVFTGANIDSASVADSMNISSSVNYDQNNTRNLYKDVFNTVATSYRSSGLVNINK